MSKENDDFKNERKKLNAAINATKPNHEQVQAHVRDTIAKAQILLKEDIKFFGDKLKELGKQK